MSWKQVRTVNINEMGHTAGACLTNTRKAASPDVPSKYNTAWEAEQHTTLHPGAAPGGVTVPVFFSFYATVDGVYKNWGHVGWLTPDGKFHSDGTTYASIAAYNASGHTPKYVGWGESLNGVQIVQYVADAHPVGTPAQGTLHLDKGTITTTFHHDGSKAGSIYARDDTYDYTIRGRNGNRVIINSASGGGNGVEVALTYINGGIIPGRHIK